MTRLTMILCLVAASASYQLHAQQIPEHLLGELLKEKVRNASTRSALQESLGLKVDEAEAMFRADVDVSEGAEPSIVIDPNDPSHLVLTFMNPTFDFPIYYSSDGGFTWEQSEFSMFSAAQDVTGGDLLGGGDPVLEFDNDGRLHLTWIYLLGSFTAAEFTVYYAYSDDFGQTFVTLPEEELVVYGNDLFGFDIIDRQWLAADRSGGENDGAIYLSGAYFGNSIAQAGQILLKKPADSNTFGDASNIHSGSPSQYGNIEVDSDGNIHACVFVFQNDEGSLGHVLYAKSIDGGVSFETDTLAENVGHPEAYGLRLVHGRENPALSMALDGSNVYIAWSSFDGTTVGGHLAVSNDVGQSWGEPVNLGQALLDAEDHHLMPALAAHWGRLSVSWFVVDSETLDGQYYVVESDDAGASFQDPQAVSDEVTDFGQELQNAFYGDYNTTAKYGCNNYLAWSGGLTPGIPILYVIQYDGCAGSVGVVDISPVNAQWQVSAIYPNPVVGHVQAEVKGSFDGVLTWRIYHENGSLLREGFTDQHLDIDVSEDASGIYLLEVIGEDGVRAVRRYLK